MAARKFSIFFVLLSLVGGVAFAATATASHQVQLNIPEVALMALNDVNPITLAVQPPGTPGDAPTSSLIDSSKVLRYTAINDTGHTRNISVAWAGGDENPDGTELRVIAAVSGFTPSGTGGVERVVATGGNIVTNIPSCYTGTGVGNGATLSFTLVVTDATALLFDDDKTVTVTFTLTDAS